MTGPGGIPGTPEQFKTLLFPVGLAMMTGPSIAGILLTGLVSGRGGLRDLIARFLTWRVGARWYMVALLTAPLLMTAVPFAFSVFFPELLPGIVTRHDKAFLLTGIAAGLVVGFCEELGWTGFAIPRWRLRYGVLSTGLIVGFLWGAWHLLVNVWSSGSPSGGISPALLLHTVLFSVGILPAYRVLMVWVYDRTGSLLVAMLLHTSLTASNVIFIPLATGVPLAIWSLVVAAALWIAVWAVHPAIDGAAEPA